MSKNENLYIFPAEVREAYERLKFPFAVYQYIEGESYLILVSDGYCQMKEVEREHIALYQAGNFYAGIHSADFGWIKEMEREFIHTKSECNVIYRGQGDFKKLYHEIHAFGTFSTMENGMELAFFVYTDLSRETPEKSIRYGNVSQADRCFIDPITRLPNIECYHKFADEAMMKISAAGETAACIYIDVDGMRFYNEEYGFEEGDRLLRVIGETVRAIFRGALITRVADDHFALITVWDDHTCDKLTRVIQQVGKQTLGASTSIKAGISPQVGERKADAVKALDQARFAAKCVGTDLKRRYVVYSNSVDDEYWNQRYIREKFAEAIEKKWIKVFYQAILRTKTGKVCNFEALARWIDPDKGMIAPDVFIPVLEKYHLISQLSAYMLETVIQQIKANASSGIPMAPVSVNLSARDFEAHDMAKLILELLDKYQVEHKWIIVELTERDIVGTTQSFQKQIRELRQHGVQVWVDDFGSGYSALNILSQYEFDLIKLDMQFLRKLDDNHGANRIIIKAIVSAARELGFMTLAEGVETVEHHQFLHEVGCDKEQGYYFAKPRLFEERLQRAANHYSVLACETEEEAQKYE